MTNIGRKFAAGLRLHFKCTAVALFEFGHPSLSAS
jgi:hypothetical protein